jgi:HTH-type transcriptional regulator / antitoxin HipB
VPALPDKRWSRVLTSDDLGRFLARLRVERGLTQAELADELGVSRRNLYEIEQGKPTLYTERLFSLLRVLGARLSIEADVDDGPPRPATRRRS